MRQMTFLLLLILPSLAQAEITARVVQINAEATKAGLMAEKPLSSKGTFLFNAPSGQTCSLKILKAKERSAVVSLVGCQAKSEIQKGQRLTFQKATGTDSASFSRYLVPELMYRPPKGRMLANLGWDYVSQDYRTLRVAVNADELNTALSSHSIPLGVEYGLLNSLSVGVQASYFAMEETTDTYTASFGGTSSTKKNSGFGDPTILIDYRLTHEDSIGFDTDLALNYSPSLMQARSATADYEGNKGRGGDSTNVVLTLGKHISQFGAGLVIGYTSLGKRTVYSGGTDVKVTRTGGSQLYFGGALQYRFSDRFFASAQMRRAQFEKSKATVSTSSVTAESDAYAGLVFGGDLAYKPIEDEEFWLLPAMSYTFYDEFGYRSGTTEYQIYNQSVLQLGIKLLAEF